MDRRRVAGNADKIGRNVKLILKDILVNTVAGSDFAVFPLRFAIYRAYGIETRTARRHGCNRSRLRQPPASSTAPAAAS